MNEHAKPITLSERADEIEELTGPLDAQWATCQRHSFLSGDRHSEVRGLTAWLESVTFARVETLQHHPAVCLFGTAAAGLWGARSDNTAAFTRSQGG